MDPRTLMYLLLNNNISTNLLLSRYCLLNSLGEEDVILDRVSHYAEPNIKETTSFAYKIKFLIKCTRKTTAFCIFFVLPRF